METDYVKFLTYKQKVFCDEYLYDRNATAAALKAGYSAKTALSGYLMTVPKIQIYLQQQMGLMAEKLQVNHEMVLRELCKIAFGNMSNYFADDGGVKPMDRLSDDDKAALEYVTIAGDGKGATVTKVKMYNKLAALDKIARHLNFYKPEEKQPERIYVYMGDSHMNKSDSFDDQNLSEEANAATEHIEEDRERELAEARVQGDVAVAVAEFEETLRDIGRRKAEDGRQMAFAHDPSANGLGKGSFGQDDTLRTLIPENTEDVGLTG